MEYGKKPKDPRRYSRLTPIKTEVLAVSKTITNLIAAGLISFVVPSYASIASAAPSGGALAIKNAASSNIEHVRWGWRGGWGWGRGWGWGVGAGVAAGALIGGALAAPYYYCGQHWWAY